MWPFFPSGHQSQKKSVEAIDASRGLDDRVGHGHDHLRQEPEKVGERIRRVVHHREVEA
jgi:hypothetical protein